jgi:hypothetical protein
VDPSTIHIAPGFGAVSLDKHKAVTDHPDAEGFEPTLYPYRYGYPWQTEVSESDDHDDLTEQTTKLYALGRQSYNDLHVMPDHKTVYATDDTTNGGFFKFVADNEGDLTQGMNYCAKFTQTSVQDDTDDNHDAEVVAAVDFTADITWLEMPLDMGGHSQENVKDAHILRFDELFHYDTCKYSSDSQFTGHDDDWDGDQGSSDGTGHGVWHVSSLIGEERARRHPDNSQWVHCLVPASVSFSGSSAGASGFCSDAVTTQDSEGFHGEITNSNHYPTEAGCTYTIGIGNDGLGHHDHAHSVIDLQVFWSIDPVYHPPAQKGDKTTIRYVSCMIVTDQPNNGGRGGVSLLETNSLYSIYGSGFRNVDDGSGLGTTIREEIQARWVHTIPADECKQSIQLRTHNGESWSDVNSVPSTRASNYPIDAGTQDNNLCVTLEDVGDTHCEEVDLNHQNNVPTQSCDESPTNNCGNWVEYRNVDGEDGEDGEVLR